MMYKPFYDFINPHPPFGKGGRGDFKMGPKKLFVWFLTLFLIFCFSYPAFAAKKSGTVKIGVLLPMTGASVARGQAEWTGIKTANKMKSTIFGKRVKLILVDTKSDRIEAADAVSRLITKDRVCAIIGDAAAGALIAEKARIPIVSPAPNCVAAENRKYVFSVCFSDSFQGKAAAQYAYHTIGARKASIMIDIARDYSIGLANSFVKNFIEMGGKISITTYCQTGDQDFATQLLAITAAKPDLLYLPNYYAEVAFTCKQAAELEIKLPILSADSAQVEELIKIGGKDVEGVIFIGHFAGEATSTRLAKRYIKACKMKNRKDISMFDALGADAYFILLDAIKRAKSTRGSGIRAVLARTKNFEGVCGAINIDKNGNAVKKAVILHVKDGEFRYIATVNP